MQVQNREIGGEAGWELGHLEPASFGIAILGNMSPLL
jgi:hypothetical protein